MRDFYSTMASIIPVLMLALIWESSFLDRLPAQSRVHKRDDAAGVRFWTKRRVRIWTIFVITTALGDLALTTVVLASFVPDSLPVRIVVVIGVAFILGSLLTRAVVDTMEATRE